LVLEDRSDIRIFGSAPSYGLTRTAGKDTALFRIVSGLNIVIANLTINDGPALPSCDYIANTNTFPCRAMFDVFRTKGITFDRVTVNGAQGIAAVSLSGIMAGSVINSTIRDSRVFWHKGQPGQRSAQLLRQH
jgi:hypothetical protein